MDVFGDKKTSKNISFFECKICDFKCSKKGDWDRHLTRPKHINLTLGDAIITTNNIYTCKNCQKKYRSRNGLWCHNKKCIIKNNTTTNNTTTNNTINVIQHSVEEQNNLIQYLMKENTEFKQLMLNKINKCLNLQKNQ